MLCIEAKQMMNVSLNVTNEDLVCTNRRSVKSVWKSLRFGSVSFRFQTWKNSYAT